MPWTRRQFLSLAAIGTVGVLAGCGRRTLAPGVPAIKPTENLGNLGAVADDSSQLYIEGDRRIVGCLVPWQPGYTVRTQLARLRQQRNFPVGFGQSQSLGSAYVYHLDDVTVGISSVPTWLY